MRTRLTLVLLILLALQASVSSLAQTPITKLKEELVQPRGLARGAVALYPKAYFAGGDLIDGSGSKAIDIYDYLTNTWDHSKQLSVARQDLAAVASGELLFFAGGRSGGSSTVPLDVVDIFDANGNRTTTQLPSGGRYSLCAAYNGGTLVYFAGGDTGAGVSDAVDIYDTSIPGWLPSKTLSEGRRYIEAGVLMGQVYFIAGENAAGNPTKTVDIFDGQSGAAGLPITEARKWGHVTVSTPTKIFIAGGYNGSVNTAIVDVIKDETNRATTSSPLSLNRHMIGATWAGNLVFFAGGRASVVDNPSNNGWSDIVDVYDLATDDWTSVKHLSEPRHGLGAVALGSKAFFAGGYRNITGPGYSKAIDVYDPEVVLSNQDLLTVIPKGVSNVTASITVDDLAKVKSVEFISLGITEPDGNLTTTALSPEGKVFKKTFTTADLSDPVGIIYGFRVTDYSDRDQTTEETVANIQYGAEAAEVKIDLVGGTTEADYRIIAVPLRLAEMAINSVFDEFGGFDKKQWRLYDYNNAESINRELNTSSSKIEIGKGYWLITRNSKTVYPGTGITAALSGPIDELYTAITLKDGWNLIGNPYSYNVSWSKVLTYNGSPAGVGPLFTFSNNNIEVGGVLSAFGGGFVENTTGADFQLKVPAAKSLSASGRVASPEKTDLNAKEWQFTLSLTDGMLTNSVGGIGMHGNATLKGRDNYDGITPPILDGIGMFEMAIYHPEVDKNFCREVVPTAGNYEWEFQILRKSENQLKLEWEPGSIAEGAKGLYLFDPATMEMKDMRTERYYNIPAASSQLRIIFGDKGYLSERRDQLLPFFGTPYPNPSAGKVSIPFHVTERAGYSNVSVNVYDGLGRFVQSVVNDKFVPGDHLIEWDADGRSGLFLIQMEASDAVVKRQKVVIK